MRKRERERERERERGGGGERESERERERCLEYLRSVCGISLFCLTTKDSHAQELTNFITNYVCAD